MYFKKSVVQVLGEHCPTLHTSCSLYLCLVKYIYYVALIANCHNIYTEIFPFFFTNLHLWYFDSVQVYIRSLLYIPHWATHTLWEPRLKGVTPFDWRYENL